MKNYLKLLTLIIFVAFTFSCSNDDNNSSNDIKNEQAEQESVQENPNIDPEAVEKYDFRKANWGMSKQEVKESEDNEPSLETENNIDYSTILLQMQAQVGYTFHNDELIRAGFFFISKLDNKNAYIEKYNEIKEELIKVNGNPVLDTEQTIDPSKVVADEDKGEAVCNGDMLYASQWDLPTTDIQLVLRGEDSECKLTILYMSEEGLRQLLEERNNIE